MKLNLVYGLIGFMALVVLSAIATIVNLLIWQNVQAFYWSIGVSIVATFCALACLITKREVDIRKNRK